MGIKSSTLISILVSLIFVSNSFCGDQAYTKVVRGEFIPFLNTLGMKFVYIKPGKLLIKNIIVDSEHRETGKIDIYKTIKGFYLQNTEVTVGQWQKFSLSEFYKNNNISHGCLIRVGRRLDFDSKSNWNYPGYKVDEYFPVTCISWNDANQFAKWLSEIEKCSYRLPTAAEWEYACKAVNAASSANDYTGISTNKNLDLLESQAWYNDNSGAHVHLVAQKQENYYGLFDMIGNVSEWCEDSFDLYVGTEVEKLIFSNDLILNMKIKAVRGCSFDSYKMTCDCSRGFGLRSDNKGYNLGFRLVKDLQ